ncbi:MAG: cyclic nucleotide-binding domain-containing protein [Anaerolineales bacterium]|nr:cyclic nucleotide-binding domain-containing protein [Anaerolineales bacterium]
MTSSRSPAKIIPRAFPGITPGEVAELINNSQLKNYPSETILCHENALENTFYLILDGEVEVTKVINNAEVRLLKNLGDGDFFGEMALIHNAPRAATVKSTTPLIVLEIHRDAFDRVLKRSSSISMAMVREISRRLRENDEMAIDDLRLRAGELAEAYQKLAELDLARREFLTNVAHKLRTPLTVANGYLDLISKGTVPAEQLTPAISKVAENVHQIMALVNDILFVQEMDLILSRFKAVDITATARSVVTTYEEIARENNVTLRLEAETDLPPVAGDVRHLERALNALVDNAIKFSPDGGEVTLRLQRDDEQVRLAIQDRGIGIAPDKISKIFDRFYHLDRSGSQLFEGIGLGLAIAKQVIAQHRGRLEVDSQPNQGSTFTLWLHLWEQDGPQEQETGLETGSTV